MIGLRARASGFGYSIDYDRAIAEDEALIVLLTSEACVRVATELVPAVQATWPADKRADSWPIYTLVMASTDAATVRQRGAIVGLTPDDLRAWAYFCGEGSDFVDDLGAVQRGDYQLGAAIDKRMERIPVYSEASRKRALSKARASLARHKRNKTKFGGT